MARPTKLTPELQEAFVVALRRCYYVEVAADLVGVDRFTVYRWIKAGKKRTASAAIRGFCDAVKKALADRECEAIDSIREAGGRNWTALAWLMERRHPDRWGGQKAELREALKLLKELQKESRERRPPAGPVSPPPEG